MNIGIDIDGVITNEKKGDENVWLRALNNYFEEKITRKKDVYSFTEAYEIPLEDLQDFLKNKLHEVYGNVGLAPRAKEIIDRLIDEGHTIYLITARHKEFRPLTIKWLQQHNIKYDYLFHEHDKAELAVEKNIKLFIEDNESNTRDLIEKGIPVILVDKYHNKSIEDYNNLYRVDDWNDIEEVLDEFLYNTKK